jgi:Purple acid Phosphatase, N-terminal domain/Calcineurin-like phosphoesterase
MTRPDLTPEQASMLSLAEQHEWFRRVTRRRRVRLAGGGAGQRATPMLLARADRPDGARVPTLGRHIAFGADPARQISVAWQVPAPVADPFLRIGESPRDLGERIAAEVRVVTTRPGDLAAAGSEPVAAAPVVQYYLHASLDGLRPGQTYYYTVGHQGSDSHHNADHQGSDGYRSVGHRSPGAYHSAGGRGSGCPDAAPVAAFRTAPTGRVPFAFTAFGDQGVTDEAIRAARLIQAQDAAFHLHAGDVSYAESGGQGLVTDSFDPLAWDSFFAAIEPAARTVPWQIAVGNHELEAWYSPDGYGGQHARWQFPGGSGDGPPPAYYSFRYGNVGVVSLDANDVSHEIPANFGYSRGAQTAWLARTLAALRADPDVDFIVAYFHHCAYCTCTGHGSEGGVRELWGPLFDRYAVDLVINGHNHVFERTDPIRAGSPTASAPPGATIHPGDHGTTYIAAGGGGAALYAFPAADSHAGPGALAADGGAGVWDACTAGGSPAERDACAAGGSPAERDACAAGGSPPGADTLRADGSATGQRALLTGDGQASQVRDPEPVRSFVHQADGTVDEDAPWSRVRYTGYCLLVVDSRPDPVRGGTLLVRAITADGTELDRLTLVR